WSSDVCSSDLNRSTPICGRGRRNGSRRSAHSPRGADSAAGDLWRRHEHEGSRSAGSYPWHRQGKPGSTAGGSDRSIVRPGGETPRKYLDSLCYVAVQSFGIPLEESDLVRTREYGM